MTARKKKGRDGEEGSRGKHRHIKTPEVAEPFILTVRTRKITSGEWEIRKEAKPENPWVRGGLSALGNEDTMWSAGEQDWAQTRAASPTTFSRTGTNS